MTYKKEKRQIAKNLEIIERLNITGTQPYDFLIRIKEIHRNLENMKIDASKINLVDMYEPIVVDLRLKLNELQNYRPESEKYKNEIFRLLDFHIEKFKEIRKIKREMEGLVKQDKEISLAEEANIIAGKSKKIAKWAIVFAIIFSLLNLLLTLFLHFR